MRGERCGRSKSVVARGALHDGVTMRVSKLARGPGLRQSGGRLRRGYFMTRRPEAKASGYQPCAYSIARWAVLALACSEGSCCNRAGPWRGHTVPLDDPVEVHRIAHMH